MVSKAGDAHAAATDRDDSFCSPSQATPALFAGFCFENHLPLEGTRE
jgi:hypothetical protein